MGDLFWVSFEAVFKFWSQLCIFPLVTCALGITPKKSLPNPKSVQFSSVAQSCQTLCDPMDCSTPSILVHHQLPELAQTHVHRVGDAIQPSHPIIYPYFKILCSSTSFFQIFPILPFFHYDFIFNRKRIRCSIFPIVLLEYWLLSKHLFHLSFFHRLKVSILAPPLGIKT